MGDYNNRFGSFERRMENIERQLGIMNLWLMNQATSPTRFYEDNNRKKVSFIDTPIVHIFDPDIRKKVSFVDTPIVHIYDAKEDVFVKEVAEFESGDGEHQEQQPLVCVEDEHCCVLAATSELGKQQQLSATLHLAFQHDNGVIKAETPLHIGFFDGVHVDSHEFYLFEGMGAAYNDVGAAIGTQMRFVFDPGTFVSTIDTSFLIASKEDPFYDLHNICPQDLRTNLFQGGGNDASKKSDSHEFGAVVSCLGYHEARKGKFDAYGAFGEHGVAIEAQFCLWEIMESTWIKMKHMKRMKNKKALHSII